MGKLNTTGTNLPPPDRPSSRADELWQEYCNAGRGAAFYDADSCAAEALRDYAQSLEDELTKLSGACQQLITCADAVEREPGIFAARGVLAKALMDLKAMLVTGTAP